MLVYEQDGDVFALRRESLECGLDVRVLGLGIYDEEVLLRVRWLRDVLQHTSARVMLKMCRGAYADPGQEHARYRILERSVELQL